MFNMSGPRYRGVKLGGYKAVCDRTGFRVYASDCRLQWDGVFVRKKSWEIRHPQDFIKAKPEKLAVRLPRPEQKELIPVEDTSVNLFGNC